MEDYGELLDDFNPEKNNLYKAFVNYFGNPLMSKSKNVNNYSIYMAKTQCMLSNMCRYIIATTPLDNNPVGYKINLTNIEWVSFQTRTLSGEFPAINSMSYLPEKKGALMATIERISKNKNSSLYSCSDFPISITLLRGKNTSDYQPTGTIISALETYNTVIMLK